MPELPDENLSTPIYIQVVSQTPGRLRLRISPQNPEQAEIQLTANYLKTFFPQVEQLKVNSQTGSVTFYADTDTNFPEILDKLQTQGIIILELPREKTQSVNFTTSLSALNEQVKKITKESVDLRIIIPFTVVAIALQRILPPLARWKTTTLYLLLWYGLESLVKLSDQEKPPDGE
ncbi:HMA2 domain-containing protein [Nostoc sp. FACHB-280]|uniref:HMA2 domain-containing protein n=1 Tax=Nostoc sp. FACHB-280 TaxID=2692839 RepID=UPI00168AA781|nr:hypothetical protein [Nostoc sp. FACHB-280]MBD2493404.1 hypothetical protein [Nostoc sp. FACHB-280]